MLRTYALVHPPHVSPKDLVAELDGIPAVENWMLVFHGLILIVCRHDQDSLYNLLIKGTQLGRGQFLVMNAATQRQGWLPKAAWDLIDRPHARGGAS